MAEYTHQDMEKMQREAENRVRDMQQRAQQRLNWENFGHAPLPSSRNAANTGNPYRPAQNARQEENRSEFPDENESRQKYGQANQEHRPRTPEVQVRSSSPFSSLLGGPMKFLENLNLKELLHDSDTALLIAILLLVSREDSDPLLTLALIYIML